MNRTKGIVAFLLVFTMLFSLAGCGSAAGNASDQGAQVENHQDNVADDKAETEAESDEAELPDSAAPDQSTDQSDETENAKSDILVVFFSRTGEQYTVGTIDKGNTAIVAEMIADATGADMFEVLPQEDYYPYTYDELTDMAKKEQNDNTRPAYQGTVPDLSGYSTVFIGAPVWWGDWPMIMYTFFENEDLEGKTLIPFSTHEGSGLSGFDKKLSSACPNSTVGKGLAIRGNDCQNKQGSVRESVNDWLSGLGY